jgi:hypothetical protein
MKFYPILAAALSLAAARAAEAPITTIDSDMS